MNKSFDKKIKEMLKLQDDINSQINSKWRLANNPWYRAIWTECAELMDHIGWKWWKNQEIDINQSHMELIDIWHFGLSDMLQSNDSLDKIVQKLDKFDTSTHSNLLLEKNKLLEKIEEFMEITIVSKRFDIEKFLHLTKAVNLNFDQIYKLYIAKNILNKFRQDNGYKSGEYIKIWEGREDNEHLYEILETLLLNKDQINLSEQLYNTLHIRYKTIK
ncbi:dUTP diphosphatase [Acinetobacter baumannii]|nr:dUTP diphosphatase [Acinetobacter baumannii]MDC4933291.1 dUTP diphosphatase [Acinetobacter baumannii]